MLRVEGDADTDRDAQLVVVIGHWLGQLADQAFGDLHGMFLGIGPANEHGELVTA